MRHLTLKFAKVSEKKYDRLLEKADLFNDYELNAVHAWLNAVRFGAYEEVRRIFYLPPNPETTWEMYSLNEIEGLQEQLLMEKAAPKLKDAWSHPWKPERVIRRDKKSKGHPATECQGAEASPADVSVRSEGNGADEGDRGSGEP